MEENMFKKIILSVITAALMVVSFSGTAMAAETGQPEGIRVRGEVIGIDLGAGIFRVETNDGTVLTFIVGDETHFRGEAQSLEELEIGWKVGVGARKGEAGRLWAVLVLSGDPEDYLQARGLVTNVNISAGKFTIEKPDGEKMTFFVDENTRYGGQLQGLEDLQEGWHAGVVATEFSPGKLLAVGVVAGDAPELLKVRGEVTSVDVGAGTFSIETEDGRSLRFYVDDKTRYQDQLTSLEDLQVGWKAGVAAKETDNGQFLAVMVIAGTRPEQIRAQGIIVGVDPAAGNFLLEKPDGSVVTFFVDENTIYRGQIEGIRDLVEGMRAGVVAVENGEGKLIARLVAAGAPPDERPELIRARGFIKTVNPGAGKFHLEKPDGTVLTIYVDGKTTYRGQVNSFDDLEKGMRAGFGGYIDQDGKIIARVVIAGTPQNDHPERPEGIRPGGERQVPESGLLGEDLSLEPNL
jgi:hypothetical protein